MIEIITIDEHGNTQYVLPYATIDLPIVDGAIADRIIIRPDWPPLGDPAFAIKLRAWHAQHNPRC